MYYNKHTFFFPNRLILPLNGMITALRKQNGYTKPFAEFRIQAASSLQIYQ